MPREFLRPWVDAGTPTVAYLQQQYFGITKEGPTKAWLHALMCFGAGLGNELFFILFIPWLFWEFDWMIARRVVYLWGSSYYLGQMAKDMFMLPRPPPELVIDCTTLTSIKDAFYRSSPSFTPTSKKQGVIRLERHYETEGGMPSTHTMNAVSMPWLIVYLVYQRIYGSNNGHLLTSSIPHNIHNDTAFMVIVITAALWTVLCILSRLYMGVHSPADMVIGGGIGITMLILHLYFGEALDTLILTSNTSFSLSSLLYPSTVSTLPMQFVKSPFIIPLVLALLAYVYPRPTKPRWVSTPGDTTVILGVVSGVSMASIYAVQYVKARLLLDYPDRKYTDDDVISYLNHRPIHVAYSFNEVIGMVVRFILGAAIMMLTRLVCKTITLPFFVTLIGHEYVPKDSIEDINLVSDNRYGEHPSTFAKDSQSAENTEKTNNSGNGNSASTGKLRQRRPHVQLSYDDKDNHATTHSNTDNKNTKENDPSPPPEKLRIKLPRNPFDTSSPANTVIPPPKESTKDTKSTLTVAPEMVKIAPTRRYIIELPVKFLTYLCVGFNAPFTIVYVLQHLLPASYAKDYGFV